MAPSDDRRLGYFPVWRAFIGSAKWHALSHAERSILLVLWCDAVPTGPDRAIVPLSTRQIAEVSGCTPRTVRRALAHFAEPELDLVALVERGQRLPPVITIPDFDEWRLGDLGREIDRGTWEHQIRTREHQPRTQEHQPAHQHPDTRAPDRGHGSTRSVRF